MGNPASTGRQTPHPSLLLSAGLDEFAAVRGALARLFREKRDTFSALFAPNSTSRRIDKLPPEQSWPLLRFGLIAKDDDHKLVGRHRIRVVGDRFYVMELGGLAEYFQDVWPETDALLAQLECADAGRLLDLGCGTGIVAIEGAKRGHRVVATDLYETAIQLAQFNARLNGASGAIEFRKGHQLEPIRGELFDLILTAPHYTRVADQLRLEVLRAAPAHLSPSGTLVVATMFEWQGGKPPMLDEILAPHCQDGDSVRVEPLLTPYKREWFTVRQLSSDLSNTYMGDAVVSRHRFLVTIQAPAVEQSQRRPVGNMSWRPPTDSEAMIQPYVPLSRLCQHARRRPNPDTCMPMSAIVGSVADVAVLQRMLRSLDAGVMCLEQGGPFVLLDACRYGARRCVTPQGFDGAAGAILEAGGTVRPCTYGQPIGRKEDTTEHLIASLGKLANAMRTRRGCDLCPVEHHCSQCLFPFPLSEENYCQLLREVPRALPLVPRLAAVLPRLAAWVANIPLSEELRVKVRRTSQLVAAQGRPGSALGRTPLEKDDQLEAQLEHVRRAWQHYRVWLAALGHRHFALLLAVGNSLPLIPISPLAAELAELVTDGISADEVRAYLQIYKIDTRAADEALALLFRCLVL
ncbi:MAG TPA: methyltransferase [Pseudomonadota bacterium]|nr:methyltransferase [Pseudomonadota bacterium]